MKDVNDHLPTVAAREIKIFKSEAHARTLAEAHAVQAELDKRTGLAHVVYSGPRDYHTGKPLCYTIARKDT
jgi:hypothetical protein